MIVVELRGDGANYSLLAEISEAGDLVVSGYDHSAWLAAQIGRAEYEYFYTVRAKHVPLLCKLLGVTADHLLDGVRALLAPHGISASTTWRAWLQAHDVSWAFSVW